ARAAVGVATRDALERERREDLTLALGTVLDRYGEWIDHVTVLARIEEDRAVIEVGPFPAGQLREELERESGDALDTRRILGAVSDGVEVFGRDGADWVGLTKRVERGTGGDA